MLTINAEGNATDIFLAVLLLVFFVVVIFFLIKSIKKERINFSEQNIKGLGEKVEFKKFLQKRIQTANRKNKFTVIQIDIYDYESLEKNLGNIQMTNVKKEFNERIAFLLSESSRVFIEEGSIFIYLKNPLIAKQLEFFVKSILKQAQKPFTLVGTLKVDIDINICVVSYPDGGKSYEDFINSMEIAMISSKRTGVNSYKMYDKQLANEQTEEYKYYKEIREAISNRDFLFFYQPVIDVRTMKFMGAEALLRWNHKTMGILLPSKFLSILEHSGDIYWVGLWAFEQLVKQYQQLKMRFPDNEFIMSMNLSPKQLLNQELVSEFKRILSKHREDPSSFCMEIVEFAMFDKVEAIQENILRLRQMGFKIAIADFGLQFSTISLLDNFPVDIIKLNKGFLEKAKGSFIKNIIEMLNKYASEKNILIIAESIEDNESLNIIKEYNIPYGQGYYFSKPVSFDSLIEILNQNLQ